MIWQQTLKKYRGGVAIFLSNTYPVVFVRYTSTSSSCPFITATEDEDLLHMLTRFWVHAEYLQDLAEQLPSPLLLIGDLKAYSLTWVYHMTNNAGLRAEYMLLNNEIVFSTREGASTRFIVGSGTFSAINLSVCRPSLPPRLLWRVPPGLHETDHFPWSI